MTWEVLTVRSKWAEDDMPQATSTSPRFLPFRIKANGRTGVFDSATDRWTPFRSQAHPAAKRLNNGVDPDVYSWFPARVPYE